MAGLNSLPATPNGAFLVGVQMPRQSADEVEQLLAELCELVKNLHRPIVGTTIVKIREVQPRFLLGSGKTTEIIEAAKLAGARTIVLDEPLSPSQQRNWTAESGLEILDRHQIILDIFAARAHTREAVLQVELARLEYELPRLRNMWSHLNRQRGGGVTQRGEGEMQIELDQRLALDRIARLKRELIEVVRQRSVQRQLRERVALPTVAIVGYTNAGKSSLLNALTGAKVWAADQLFATLDPTTRQMSLPSGRRLLVTDTVGFVRRLPHRLVEAFRATLEEALGADLLIHVMDASSPEVAAHYETTRQVLSELGALTTPTLTVFNKIDRLPNGQTDLPAWAHDPEVSDGCVPVAVSCSTGAGLPLLLERLDTFVGRADRPLEFLIPYDRYELVHRLHDSGGITRQEARDDGVVVIGHFPPRLTSQLAPFHCEKSQILLDPADECRSRGPLSVGL